MHIGTRIASSMFGCIPVLVLPESSLKINEFYIHYHIFFNKEITIMHTALVIQIEL